MASFGAGITIMATISYIVLRSNRSNSSHRSVNSQNKNTSDNTPPQLTEVASNLTKLARKHELYCNAILLMIIFSLSTGAWIYINSDRILTTTNVLASAEKTLATLREKLQTEKSMDTKKVNDIKIALEKFDNSINSLRAINDTSNKESSLALISSITARVGAIVIIVFFVQILANLYKYNARLASFYVSRVNALALIPANLNFTLKDALDISATDNFDFSKAERPPTQQAVDLAKQILESFSKK